MFVFQIIARNAICNWRHRPIPLFAPSLPSTPLGLQCLAYILTVSAVPSRESHHAMMRQGIAAFMLPEQTNQAPARNLAILCPAQLLEKHQERLFGHVQGAIALMSDMSQPCGINNSPGRNSPHGHPGSTSDHISSLHNVALYDHFSKFTMPAHGHQAMLQQRQ